jgi:hypothetical protein
MPRLAEQMKEAADMDSAAFHAQMIIKGALMSRGIYVQFPAPIPLQRAERYRWDPVKEAGLCVEALTGQHMRLAAVVRGWCAATPTMTSDEIISGFHNMREFFKGNDGWPWFEREMMDITILYAIRTWAPPSRVLSMAIRRMIMADAEDERSIVVRSVQEPYMSEYLSRALKEAPRDTLLNVAFRNDCQIALAIASMNLNDKNPELVPLQFCIRRAAELARRWPLVQHYIRTHEMPETPANYDYMVGWQDGPALMRACADIIGAV